MNICGEPAVVHMTSLAKCLCTGALRHIKLFTVVGPSIILIQGRLGGVTRPLQKSQCV